VAEIYGESPAARIDVAGKVLDIFETTDGVVDADWYVEAAQPRVEFKVDRDRAALAGVDAAQVAHALRLAVDGVSPALAHTALEREPVPVVVRLPRAGRTSTDRLEAIRLAGTNGTLVPLSEVAHLERTTAEPWLYRKNGRPVTYVIGDVAGAEESPVYALMKMSGRVRAIVLPSGAAVEERYVDDGRSGSDAAVVWDGEWQITYQVFRDLGLAFGAVLILIYFLVVAWFKSFMTPFLIMLPIPLTLVGILPGHVLTGIFFTATSMIGLIALAGIIVRNSILLVDFIELTRRSGESLREAVLQAGAVRFRPIFLTGITVVAGDLVMLLDPIFQGLAVALISGIFASTTLTLFVIPLLYYMANRGKTAAAAAD
jgi:multidrug efflux pump subunit AcrB